MGAVPCALVVLQRGRMMTKTNPGKRFEAKLKSSFERCGMYAMRIPDKVYWTGSRIASDETPADFVAFNVSKADGSLHCYLIEAKACSRSRINFSALKSHQKEALVGFDSMHEDMHGYVAVNFYDSVSLSRLDVCFMVPISVWTEYESKDGAMKSISHAECLNDDRVFFCQKVKGGVYDMEVFANGGA